MHVNKLLGLTMMFIIVHVMRMVCWYWYLCSKLISYTQLVNYCSIIQLDGCMCSFCCGDNFVMIMISSVKLVDNKGVDNLLICIVLKFHSYRLKDLRVIASRSLLVELLILWTDLNDRIV